MPAVAGKIARDYLIAVGSVAVVFVLTIALTAFAATPATFIAIARGALAYAPTARRGVDDAGLAVGVGVGEALVDGAGDARTRAAACGRHFGTV